MTAHTNLTLDTGALSDFLTQYFASDRRDQPQFMRSGLLPSAVIWQMNRIAKGSGDAVVVASSLAFVELTKKWDNLVSGAFSVSQLAAFIENPPEWFVIDPIDNSILPFFARCPSAIISAKGQEEPIEWTDAVHIATALSRSPCFLVTTDQRINQLQLAGLETI